MNSIRDNGQRLFQFDYPIYEARKPACSHRISWYYPRPKHWRCTYCDSVTMEGSRRGECCMCRKTRAVGPDAMCARCASRENGANIP